MLSISKNLNETVLNPSSFSTLSVISALEVVACATVMRNPAILPILKILTSFYVAVSTTLVALNANAVVQVLFRKLGNNRKLSIPSLARVSLFIY